MTDHSEQDQTDTPAAEIFALLSPDALFFREPRWRKLILKSLRRQGIQRVFLPSPPPSYSDIPETPASRDSPELVHSTEAFMAPGRSGSELCLVFQDNWSPGMNLDQLIRQNDGKHLLCQTVLSDTSPAAYAEEGIPVFTHTGEPREPTDIPLPPASAVYGGAFSCRPDVLRDFWQHSHKRFPGKLTPEDRQRTPPWRGLLLDSTGYGYGAEQEAAILRARNWMEYEPGPALFLDRDGVINLDSHFPYRPEDLVILPGIIPVLQMARQRGYRVLVLTNQSGVARGYFREEDVARFHQTISEQLACHGVHIDGFWICPFHPEGTVPRYTRVSGDRKPLPGLALKAMARFPTRLRGSLMAGDRDSDRLLLPGLESVLIKGKYPVCSDSGPVVNDFQELADFFDVFSGNFQRH